jgi:DNA repair protein RadC
MQSIKSLPLSERPREKMLQFGSERLETTELLSLLLGSGSSEVPVHKLAKRIQNLYEKKKKVEITDFLDVKGIGPAKACQIVAAMELSERLRPSLPDEIMNSVDKFVLHLYDLKYSTREQVVGLYLNARMKLVHKEVLSIGTLNQAFITPKEVFGVIKHHPILYFVLAHNHPSGDTSPSKEDLIFTKRLKDAGELLGVTLLDHIILGKNGHYSFKANGQL